MFLECSLADVPPARLASNKVLVIRVLLGLVPVSCILAAELDPTMGA
jgi:hypothetical protein